MEDDSADRPEEAQESGTLVTLLRGLSVLEEVAAAGGATTAKAISRKLGINLGTTYHLLRTLRASGYIVRLHGGQYDVGASSSALSRRLQLRCGPPPELSPLLVRLHNRTQETAYLCGWYHGTIMLQQYIAGQRALIVRNLEAGYSGNMHARASCKAVLAFLPEKQVATMFSGLDLPRVGPKTVDSYEELVESLTQTRRQGYALDLEEFAEGVCCISAPFFGADDAPLGSFTVSVPISRFQTSQTKLIADTREVAVMATNLFRTGFVVVNSTAKQPPNQAPKAAAEPPPAKPRGDALSAPGTTKIR
jgi:IclR family acetate operon transcriptional repressor